MAMFLEAALPLNWLQELISRVLYRIIIHDSRGVKFLGANRQPKLALKNVTTPPKAAWRGFFVLGGCKAILNQFKELS